MVGKLRNGVGRASNGALEESVSTSQDCPEEVKNKIHVHSSLRDNAVNEPCSASENIDVSESDGSVSLDGPKGIFLIINKSSKFTTASLDKYFLFSFAEATTCPSSTCGGYDLLGTCALCSKSRRYVSMS